MTRVLTKADFKINISFNSDNTYHYVIKKRHLIKLLPFNLLNFYIWWPMFWKFNTAKEAKERLLQIYSVLPK